MRKKIKIPYQAGLSLLLVVVIVLCLVTFSMLSYVSANRDYANALQAADRTVQYYDSDLKARTRLANMNTDLLDIYDNLPSKTETAFLEECRIHFPQMQENQLTFTEEMGEKQFLEVCISLKLPDLTDDSFYKINSWRIVTAGSWNADDSLPVFGHTE